MPVVDASPIPAEVTEMPSADRVPFFLFVGHEVLVEQGEDSNVEAEFMPPKYVGPRDLVSDGSLLG